MNNNILWAGGNDETFKMQKMVKFYDGSRDCVYIVVEHKYDDGACEYFLSKRENNKIGFPIGA